ncbi:DNA adenine methylase [Actinomyces ruminicola]|uniref:DNA adenine methylase n=1 Tax=Actinomyces ruminicola TaxID=332524 RepID=UPI0011C8EA09|nr:DNA adenine methylase [Actinomyces ruminicola]
MRYLSPLRYPGGKARLAPFFARLITAQDPTPTQYAEPYAGGAGAALRLLSDGIVDQVHINDINAGIAAFWRTITTNDGADAFCELISTTSVTIDEWHRQRATYQAGEVDDLALGFATFFLNRTNRSGILDARPIGGLDQTGDWKIDARFNKKNLTARVQAVAALGDRIGVTQMDGIDFLRTLEGYEEDVLIYADPPYIEQGNNLYLHAFDADGHKALANTLLRAPYPWLLTYDDKKVIWADLYGAERCARFNIAHTAAIQHIGRETIVYGPGLNVPGGLEITPGVYARWVDTAS